MNDILKPDLIWVEGRCYRVNDSNTEISGFEEHDLYRNEEIIEDENEEEDDFEVEMINESRYSTNFHVSKHYLGAIIGKKGANKARIEHDTKTTIKIPRQGQAGNIVILGPSAANVKMARRRINIIVISSRMKQKPTHFLSIPMNTPEIMKSFEDFKESVLKECPSRGLDESLFIKPSKLHVTMGVMCLMDNEERLQASKLLTDAKYKVVMPLIEDHLPLKLHLKGLSYMNDDPRDVDVLYGTVREEENAPVGLLQRIADSLVDYFYKAGFMDKMEYGIDKVRLHVTLINSKYRSAASSTNIAIANNQEPQSRYKRTRVTFDGSGILEKFSDYDFGVMELTEVHLSQRHAMRADGFYQPTCVIACNKKENANQ